MYTIKFGNWTFGIGSNMNNGHKSKRPLALIILDGWGISPHKEGNAIALAHTPYYDEICAKYPRTNLSAAGLRVGLTPDSAGNPEVGHLNLGAGRIVQTDVSRISEALRSGDFFENQALKKAFAKAAANNSSVHLIGLLSDGDAHSKPENLFALLRMAKAEGLRDVFVHPILDGRDVSPRTADIYAEALEIKMADIGVGQIATLCGRYYAMDSNQNWERTARAYTMLVHAEGERAFDAVTAIRSSFLRGIADEFIAPIVLEKEPGKPVATIKNGDVVIYFNHRADGMRQIVKSLSIPDSNDFAVSGKPRIETVCLIEYDRGYNLPVAFLPESENNVLAQVFAEYGVLNCRLTESERYPHLTYFFNGGVENENLCEQRVLVQSPKNAAYELQPEMSSFKVTDKFLRSLEAGENDVFIMNLPASDLVAQTGNLEKTIESVQFVDTCLGGILEKIREMKGVAMITSSHGGCEEMADLLTGEPNSQPTANPVPFHFIDEQANGLLLRDNGALEDVAPTILGILGIEKPAEMTGRDLRLNN
ncbi:MAG: 2,3-bisphosphoglycerate-independent phosphoglycerate mutase [Acidobacteria bacterium]|jgi:2,3-bisphosphoglycerate-independent phosphoglycerate mutase|nr:2,3-bisphosphoglycerate-independent phosphoglycerate mutase [Acidobacteriota bacterium]